MIGRWRKNFKKVYTHQQRRRAPISQTLRVVLSNYIQRVFGIADSENPEWHKSRESAAEVTTMHAAAAASC
jgi:hypothetical protein